MKSRKCMARKPKPKPDDKGQSQRFVETARSLDVDESSDKFEENFQKVIPQKNRKK